MDISPVPDGTLHLHLWSCDTRMQGFLFVTLGLRPICSRLLQSSITSQKFGWRKIVVQLGKGP